MARSATTWQSGQSGNPKGKPPKARQLATRLAVALSHRLERDGKTVSGKDLLARLVVDAVFSGSLQFPDGTRMAFGPDDWKDLVKFVYSHIDGPAVQKVAPTTPDGEREYGSDAIERLVSRLLPEVTADGAAEPSSDADGG